MIHPTEKQVREAAKTSKEACEALKTLYPELFLPKLKPGEIYSWGTDADGGSGVVAQWDSGNFMFIGFHSGIVYLHYLPSTATKHTLNSELMKLAPKNLHNCYFGSIKGPRRFKSWCTK